MSLELFCRNAESHWVEELTVNCKHIDYRNIWN